MISFLITSFETILNNLYNPIIGGVSTGISAISVYVVQKRLEHNANRSSYASILYEEIIRNANKYYSIESITSIQILKRTPTNHVYRGLLTTGNIKYFDNNIQNDLEDIYDQFSIDPTESILNPDLLKQILLRLEKMKKRKMPILYLR